MKIPSQEALETTLNEADERGEFTPRRIASMLRQIMVRVDAAFETIETNIELYFVAEDEAKEGHVVMDFGEFDDPIDDLRGEADDERKYRKENPPSGCHRSSAGVFLR